MDILYSIYVSTALALVAGCLPLTCFAADSASVQTAPVPSSPAINYAVKGIQDSARSIARNTAPTLLQSTDTDEYVNLSLSIIAALGTVLTAVAVQLEFKQRAISREIQRRVLFDLIRHLYRNKVCICAVAWKLERQGYASFYPSEEHLLKLKVLPEDLRFDRFNNTPQYYDILHALELKFRNYNTEVDVALAHLKEKELLHDSKKRDLAVLSKKSDYLTKEIMQLMLITQGRFKSSPELSLLLSRVVGDAIGRDPKPSAGINAVLTSRLPWRSLDKAHRLVSKLMAQIENLIVNTSSEYASEIVTQSASERPPEREPHFYDRRARIKLALDADISREYTKISLIQFPGRTSRPIRRGSRKI